MRDNWTEEQITVVLYEYCRKPFGQFSMTKPFVIELGQLLGRSPGAIVRKVGNLAHFDPMQQMRGVGGLSNTSKLDKVVWDRYYGDWEKLTLDAENLLASLRDKSFEESVALNIDLSNIPYGEDRYSLVKQRVNQNFFRETVLASYQNRCCITGIGNPTLLNACHISDWSSDIRNRTNPENGLCMNVLMHKAYDSYLLAVTPDYEIVISDSFFGKNCIDNDVYKYFKGLNHKSIIMPTRFSPNTDLLALHYEEFVKAL